MLNRVIDKIHHFNAARELKRYAPKILEASQGLSPKQLVDFVFSEQWQRFFWIKQEYSEVLSLCEIIAEKKPKVILEIGTAQGGSLFLFTKLAHPEATIISVDLPKGDFGGGYEEYKSSFYKSFVTGKQKMHLLRTDSHLQSSRDHVSKILQGQAIDFMFIDGDHTYEGVKTDYELYSPLVSDDGLIGFHDIVASTAGCEVCRFWNELKPNFNNVKEFVNNPSQPFCGVGLLSPKDKK